MAAAQSSTSIVIQWDALPDGVISGIFLGYRIVCQETDTGKIIERTAARLDMIIYTVWILFATFFAVIALIVCMLMVSDDILQFVILISFRIFQRIWKHSDQITRFRNVNNN